MTLYQKLLQASSDEAVNDAIRTGEIVRAQITPDNLKQVFDKWVTMIGRELVGASPDDYAQLFFADIMTDEAAPAREDSAVARIQRGTEPVLSIGGKDYSAPRCEGYRQFWSIYVRPTPKERRNRLLERRDGLIPPDERRFKGAYYTPLNVVDKAYDLLAQTLGGNWQREYLVWDMCCGVGNLETKHSNPRNIFMSTLDQADVDVMKAARTCVQAERFQYDYLNDDITALGEIDYSLTGKIPPRLQKAIQDGKKILVLMNPPYAEAMNADNTTNEVGSKDAARKKGVAGTLIAEGMNVGFAKRELFVQFLARIAKEIPNATIAMFSTLKYVNAPNFEKFRDVWNARYLGGFVVHSKAFDGLNGNFPIGFLIWRTDNKSAAARYPIEEISCEALDKDARPVGEKKFYNIPTSRFLSEWIVRPRPNNEEALPLKNAVSPTTRTNDVRGTRWADGAIGCMMCNGNDLQHTAQLTALFSSGVGSAGGYLVTKDDLWKSAIVFSVRRLIKPTWLNDRDQFLQPTGTLTDAFKNDCLVWMLFNGSNLTASADGLEWNGKTWSLVNHFIPFTETEVKATGRFESDFMVEYMAGKTFSPESRAVLEAGKALWRAYFSRTDNYSVREQFKLNRPDVGWYQIRNALKARNESGECVPVDFTSFETAYSALSDKLRPLVYELGFLK